MAVEAGTVTDEKTPLSFVRIFQSLQTETVVVVKKPPAAEKTKYIVTDDKLYKMDPV